MTTTTHWRRLGLVVVATTLVACASDPGGVVGAGQGFGTGNSGHGHTASMASADEEANSPSPGGMGGTMSRTMAGGAGYWTLIGTETGASWKTPTAIGGGPTR